MKQTRIGLLATVLVCANLTISAQEAGEHFSIATLNVDGLPQKTLVLELNADGPGDAGTARIGKYLKNKGYDLVMMQEDFNYHGVLSVWLEDDYKMDEWSGDVGIEGHDIDFFHLQNHRFECDGLMACWKNDLQVTAAARTPWTQNFGKFSHANDEMVTKGFRRYDVTLRSGDRIVVYNLHMDATMEEDEIEMKGENFIDAINETGKGTASDVWVELKQGGVYPAKASTEATAGEETLDKIIYINPTMGTMIQPVAFSIDKDGYLYEGKPLGDHWPVAATFQVTSTKTAINEISNDQHTDSRWYNLNGQRVNQPQNGIYIEQKGEKSDKRIIKN